MGTIDELRTDLADVTSPDVVRVRLEEETAGENRKGAVELLEAKLAELTGEAAEPVRSNARTYHVPEAMTIVSASRGQTVTVDLVEGDFTTDDEDVQTVLASYGFASERSAA
jgi:hypothetical protein